jgi:dipeptidyl aminopeptidase/acylaminoacyl peptidase
MKSFRLVFAAALAAAPLAAQKPALTAADYAKWEILGNGVISPDGKWVAYDFRRNSGEAELRWHAVDSDAEKIVKMGNGATFTRNSRYLIYTISADTTGAGGRGGRGGRGSGAGAGGVAASASNHNKAAIVDLRTGAATTFEDIQSFVVSADGAHVAFRRYAPTGRAGRGADLVVRDLDAGTDVTLGNVGEYAWSDDGALLAMTIDVDGKTGNGVQLLEAANGNIRSLDASDAQYVNLLWRPHATDLVVFRSRADSAFADTSFAVIAWRGLASGKPSPRVYDFGADAGFPQGMRVAAYRRPQWDDDGTTLFFGIAQRERKPAGPATRAAGALAPARVEIWHWKDLREFHTQQVSGAQDRQRTQLVAWHVVQEGIVRLSANPFEQVQFSDNHKAAIASDEDPYFKEIISGRDYRDLYRLDLTTGKREKLATKTPFAPVISPSGRAALLARAGQWWYQDLNGGAPVSLTRRIKNGFVNVEDDHPVPERRPYGLAGWVTGEKSVIVYDRFDLWQINVDGSSAVRLTKGREDSTVYRYVSLDADARTIDAAKPLTLSATGEWSKKSGYSRVQIGQPVQRLVWLDKGVARLVKAKDVDEYLFTQQSYEDSPNIFAAGPALANAKPQSHTNAFQGDYAWSKQVLLPYTNKRGDKLQMMLTYPANYQPGKKYPMVVYYYETLSNTHHQYVVPSERAVYNTTVFAQEGYFVLRPDIRFQARSPGWSGLDCVTAAVKAAVATGMIDPAKVGNMGHSWGGYQSAFYAVHGRGVFAASIAGAPLTNLISMYGYSSGNTGQPETGHYETSQERMEVPLWEDPKAYISNSTVFATDSLQIPLLLEEGDADGNVNYYQSMELYNFGRRLGKNVVFLVYEGENHNVARPESQADYHKRQLEWFGHYLKGDPAPNWITNGETYLERQRILREGGVTPVP